MKTIKDVYFFENDAEPYIWAQFGPTPEDVDMIWVADCEFCGDGNGDLIKIVDHKHSATYIQAGDCRRIQ